MDFNAFKQAVIAAALEMGIEEYEIYYQTAESASVSAFRHELNQFTSSVEGGVCLRCIVNGRMGYASTEDLRPEGAAALLARAADNARTLEAEEQVFLNEGGKTYTKAEPPKYALPNTQTLVSIVLDTQEKLYKADAAVIDGCTTQGISESNKIAIYNSKGLDLSYGNDLSGMVVAAVVKGGTEMANDYQIKLGCLQTMDREELTKKAAEGALQKLGGEPAPTGQYPVVFSSEAVCDLLSTFCGVFSSEAAQKGLSKLADKEGQAIAAPCVTLVDDPFYPENPMPIGFDAEGSPTFRKNVIEKGVLNTLLYNLKTAHQAGRQTTGNAAKGSYDSPVAVRPFTMYLAPGGLTEAELLEKAGNGVYIDSLSGLHAGANPITGDFSLQSAGFLIEDGKKTKRVKAFTVAGNFYRLLQDVEALSDQVILPRALGMTAFGAPALLAKGLSIAGK